jgi:hypothetical protein
MSVTGEEVKRFLANEGDRGQRVLALLHKMTPIKQALESEIGMILLKDIAKDMEPVLDKIIEEVATDKDIADFRAGKRLADKIAQRINKYYKEEEKVLRGKI